MMIQEITESESAQIELTPQEVVQLSTLGRRLASRSTWWGETSGPEGEERRASVIDCTSDGSHGTIVVRNAIGVIAINGRQILVRPKIDVSHLFHLLGRGGIVPAFVPSEIALHESADLFELVARWFVAAAERLLRIGIVRDYAEVADDLIAVRGTLNVVRTAEHYYSGRLALQCTFEEYGLDTPLNRIVKAAARRVSRETAFSHDLRFRAARTVHRLDTVSDVRHSDLRTTLDRRTAHYSDAFMLSRLLLQGESRTLERGDRRAWIFLIPTPLAVERGIRSILAEGLRDFYGVTSGKRLLTDTRLSVNPDLTFGRDGVADVKYKLYDSMWDRGDLYQAVAFAAAFEAERAAVISFKRDGRTLTALTFGRIIVDNFCWRTDVTPLEAQRHLVRAAARWLALPLGAAA